MPMPSFGRGGARSGSMIGRRNLPGTGRGFNGSLFRTRVGRTPWATSPREGPQRQGPELVLREGHDGPVALGRGRHDDAPESIIGLVRHAEELDAQPHEDVARRLVSSGRHEV